MSHELRTPINAILGYNSLLRDGIIGDPSEEQVHALERVHASSRHLLSIINDILDLSKVEAGHVTLNPVEVEIPALVDSISEALWPLALGERLEYRVDLAPALPVIHVDETRLKQILLNLLSNGVKFTPSGSVTLRVIRPSEGTVRFEVEDTGIGIKPEDLDAIFEEFRQVDQSQTRKYGGTGLGLTMCKKLGTLMGGTLSVVSTPGVGSVFRIDLPLKPSHLHLTPPEHASPATTHEPSVTAP
jgi:signal transduction histidine kinase